MLKNYLTVALRNLQRHKGYAFINVAGLGLGLACCLLIGLYVRHELSYDAFHAHADRIVRVQKENIMVTPTIVAPLFKRTFPEVEEATRFYDMGGYSPQVVRYGDIVYQEEGFFYADSTAFEVLDFPFVAGDPKSALAQPGTLVLTQSMARKYFGEAEALGKVLRVGPEDEFEVTGVLEDLPSTSHLQFDFLASFASTNWAEREIWSSANFLTYVLLRRPDDITPLRQKIEVQLAKARAEEQIGNSFDLVLVPLRRIHLDYEGRRTYVVLLAAIALLVLLVACINYMNLATARATRRAREVGVRKVVGAHRGQLIGQFYGESALMAVLALGVATVLAALTLPLFNTLSGQTLTLRQLGEPVVWAALLGIGLVITLVAGSYPALLLSGFRPAQVLKGYATASGGFLRKALVVFQFGVSIFLLVATAVVYNQLRYVQTANLGFDRDHVVVLPLGDQALYEARETLKAELLQLPGVRHAAVVNPPSYRLGGYSLTIEGMELPEGEFFPIGGVASDADAIEALGLQLIAGEGFPKSPGYEPDSANYVYIVNETALRLLGWTPEEALGRRMSLSDSNRMGTLVGIVKDYHIRSLHEPIYPVAHFIEPWEADNLAVRIAPNDVAGTIAGMERVWNRLAPHRPFTFSFLRDDIDALYRAEQQTGRLFAVFAMLAVLIACLGLFGLAAYMAEQRTKEIGVRKVLGAGVAGLVALLSRDFLVLVTLGFVLAAPLAYVAAGRWLENFAFHVELGPGVFVLAGALALLVALLTVSYQAVKAALADPVKALRYE